MCVPGFVSSRIHIDHKGDNDNVNNKRAKIFYTLPVVVAAAMLILAPLTLMASEHEKPSATIELVKWKVGFVIGGGGGGGTLHFQGQSHELGIKGLRIGAVVGISRADIKGEVFNLTDLKAIEGNYKAFQTSGSFAGGPTKFWELKNDKGVVLKLHGAQAGLELALDYGGMWLKLE